MKQWLKSVLSILKHSKPTDENIRRLLMPSFLGILLCMVCLAGTTWSWFTASISTLPQSIISAEYQIEVKVGNETVTSPKALIANTEYIITLTASGTADKYGGYCILEGGEKPLYSVQLRPENVLSFNFIPSETKEYTFTSVWGTYSGEPDITAGCTIGKKTEVQENIQLPEGQQNHADEIKVHIVQAEDSLEKIAAQYGTTVEKLMAYNHIDPSTALQAGQKIKIPPQGYEIPSEPGSTDEEPGIPERNPGGADEESGVPETNPGGADTEPGIPETNPGGADEESGVPETNPGDSDTEPGKVPADSEKPAAESDESAASQGEPDAITETEKATEPLLKMKEE